MNISDLKSLVLAGAAATVLTACSGGTCAANNSGQLTLAINAPSQYPAGIAVTATLVMKNTSNVNGTNLVYTVPATTNYTGVTITPDPSGAGQDCSSWTLLTGDGTSAPSNANHDNCNYAFLNSILISDTSPNFWIYNGSSWSKITGGVNQPTGQGYCNGWVGFSYANPPTDLTSLYYNSSNVLWYYNGSSWNLDADKRWCQATSNSY